MTLPEDPSTALAVPQSCGTWGWSLLFFLSPFTLSNIYSHTYSYDWRTLCHSLSQRGILMGSEIHGWQRICILHHLHISSTPFAGAFPQSLLLLETCHCPPDVNRCLMEGISLFVTYVLSVFNLIIHPWCLCKSQFVAWLSPLIT